MREPGIELLTCSAEDLIVHKAFAARDGDWADVNDVVGVQRSRLDTALILRELAPLAEFNTKEDVMVRLLGILKRHGLD